MEPTIKSVLRNTLQFICNTFNCENPEVEYSTDTRKKETLSSATINLELDGNTLEITVTILSRTDSEDIDAGIVINDATLTIPDSKTPILQMTLCEPPLHMSQKIIRDAAITAIHTYKN